MVRSLPSEPFNLGRHGTNVRGQLAANHTFSGRSAPKCAGFLHLIGGVAAGGAAGCAGRAAAGRAWDVFAPAARYQSDLVSYQICFILFPDIFNRGRLDS